MKALIIYHGPHCNDGMTAAWVTARGLKRRGIAYELYPMNYGEEQADALLTFMEREGKNYIRIYIVDFSLSIPILERLTQLTVGATVTVLDHHKTAFETYGYDMDEFHSCSALREYYEDTKVEVILDNSLSGAGVCWQHFFSGERIPPLVRYVQDRDIWTFKYPETKAMHMFISTREKSIAEWDILHAGLEDLDGHAAIYKLGTYLLEEYIAVVAAIAETAVPCVILRHQGLMANCEGQYASDVGNILATTSGTYGLTFHESADGEHMHCSLRSEAGGDFDVERLARNFQGGGHKSAAGFKVSLESIASKFFQSEDRQELQFND